MPFVRPTLRGAAALAITGVVLVFKGVSKYTQGDQDIVATPEPSNFASLVTATHTAVKTGGAISLFENTTNSSLNNAPADLDIIEITNTETLIQNTTTKSSNKSAESSTDALAHIGSIFEDFSDVYAAVQDSHYMWLLQCALTIFTVLGYIKSVLLYLKGKPQPQSQPQPKILVPSPSDKTKTATVFQIMWHRGHISAQDKIQKLRSRVGDLTMQKEISDASAGEASIRNALLLTDIKQMKTDMKELPERYEKLELALYKKTTEAEELSSKLRISEKKSANLTADNNSKQTAIVELGQKLEQQKTKAADLTVANNNKQTTIIDLEQQQKKSADLITATNHNKQTATVELEQKLEQQKTKSAGLTVANNNKQTTIVDLKQKLEQQKTESAGLTVANNSKQTTIIDLRKMLKQQNEKFADLTATNNRKQYLIESLNNESKEQKAKVASIESSLKSEQEGKKAQLDEHHRTMESSKSHIKDLQRRLEETKTQLQKKDALVEDQKTPEGRIKKYEAQIEASNEEIAKLQTALKTLKDSEIQNRATITQLEQKVSDLNTKNKQHDETPAHTAEIQQYQHGMESLQTANSQLSQSLQSAQSEAAEMRNNVARLQNSAQSSQSNVSEMQSNNNDLRQSLALAESKVAEVQASNNELYQSLQTSQSTAADMHAKLNNIIPRDESEINNYTNTIRHQNEELERLRKMVSQYQAPMVAQTVDQDTDMSAVEEETGAQASEMQVDVQQPSNNNDDDDAMLDAMLWEGLEREGLTEEPPQGQAQHTASASETHAAATGSDYSVATDPTVPYDGLDDATDRYILSLTGDPAGSGHTPTNAPGTATYPDPTSENAWRPEVANTNPSTVAPVGA